jgi:hypothetical protein
MQVATGTVISGQIVVEGVALADGAVVTVVSHGADETFMLSAEQEGALAAALQEVDAGKFVSIGEVLGSLPKPN